MAFSALDSSHRLEHLAARAESQRRRLLHESQLHRELAGSEASSLLSSLARLAARTLRALAPVGRRAA